MQIKKQQYNSNLQKAGAALEDIKILLKNWKMTFHKTNLLKNLLLKMY